MALPLRTSGAFCQALRTTPRDVHAQLVIVQTKRADTMVREGPQATPVGLIPKSADPITVPMI